MKKTKSLLKVPLQTLIDTYGKQQVVDQLTQQWKQQSFVNLNPHFIEDTPALKNLTLRAPDLARAKEELPLLGKSIFIVVRFVDNHHQLMLGRKHLYAAKMAGMLKVPVIKLVVTDEEALLIVLSAMRDDASPSVLGLALLCKTLSDNFGYSQQVLAQLLHYSRPQISNLTRLLELPVNTLKLLNAQLLSYGHAKVLVGLPPERIAVLTDLILQKNLSVHQLEALVTQEKKGLLPFEEQQELENKLASSISMNQTSVTFKFKNPEEKKIFLKKLIEKI